MTTWIEKVKSGSVASLFGFYKEPYGGPVYSSVDKESTEHTAVSKESTSWTAVTKDS